MYIYIHNIYTYICIYIYIYIYFTLWLISFYFDTAWNWALDNLKILKMGHKDLRIDTGDLA